MVLILSLFCYKGQKEGESSRNSEANKSSNSFNLDRASTQRTSNLRSLS